MTVNEFICRIREFKPFDDLFSEFEKEWEGYPQMIFFSFLGKRIAQDCDRYTEEESDFIFFAKNLCYFFFFVKIVCCD